MSQQTETIAQKQPWVLVSSFKKNISQQDIEKITPKIMQLIDEWQSKGQIMWSGAFNDNNTGMAIFEATTDEANEFYAKYDKICSGVLNYFLYQWDAMPILSLLSK